MQVARPLPVAITLCTFAGFVLFALHPKPSVQLEGEIAMLDPLTALQRLDAASGITFQRNLAQTHAALALDAGEFAVATKVLLQLQAEGPDVPEIDLRLADASRLSGDPANELAHLAAAYALAPSAALRQKLGLAYRENRQPEPERALLLSAAGKSLTSYEERRLADLLRAERKFGLLETLYRDRANGEGPDADAAKQLFINLLLESGRPTEAQQQTMRWFKMAGWDQHILQTAIPAFVNWGALDEAMALAISALGVAPDSSYQLIMVFLDGGHQDRAFAMQQAWLDRVKTIPLGAWPALITVAERTGNLGGLRTALAKTPPDAVPSDHLSAALMQFLRYQGAQSLYPQAIFLRPDVLSRQPLIGAAWAAGQGQQLETAAFLMSASEMELSEWDWLIWGDLAASLRGSPAYQRLLATVPTTSRARSMLESAFMARL